MRTEQAAVTPSPTISLLAEDDLRPSAPRIAERAGVSVRSVFQHFDDLETLFAAVGERVVNRLSRLIVPINPELSLDQRIVSLVTQRALLLEVVTPVRRAASVHSVGSPAINGMFQTGHHFLDFVFEDVAQRLSYVSVDHENKRSIALRGSSERLGDAFCEAA